MPLNNLAFALIETSINKLQTLDSTAKGKRKQLDNQVIGVALKEINKPIYFVISHQQIDLLSHFEGECDCFIRVSLSVINDLKNNHQLTSLIKDGTLDVEGDIQIAQKFAQLLTEMEIDWEEHLSTKIGDVAAHKLCYFVRLLKESHQKQWNRLEKHVATLITHEFKIAPGPLEVVHFCDQIDNIKADVAQADKNIQNLLTTLDKHDKN